MALEIERKFLVTDNGWKAHAEPGKTFVQGYLCGEGPSSVRVRIEGDEANINIKAAIIGASRAEYEYSVPLADAQAMLDELCVAPPVEKTRYRIPNGDHVWEMDVFGGANEGLVVAEIELAGEDEPFETPQWLGREVTHERCYYNQALALHPYCDWQAAETP